MSFWFEIDDLLLSNLGDPMTIRYGTKYTPRRIQRKYRGKSDALFSTLETQFRDPWLLGDVERVSSYCRMPSEMS